MAAVSRNEEEEKEEENALWALDSKDYSRRGGCGKDEKRSSEAKSRLVGAVSGGGRSGGWMEAEPEKLSSSYNSGPLTQGRGSFFAGVWILCASVRPGN
jgi:hypothetical protein